MKCVIFVVAGLVLWTGPAGAEGKRDEDFARQAGLSASRALQLVNDDAELVRPG